MAAGGVSLPVSVGVCLVASLLGGNVLWFAVPRHRQEAYKTVHDAIEKVAAFERNVGTKLKASQKKLLQTFHLTDHNNDGKVTVEEFLRTIPLHPDDEEHTGFWTNEKMATFAILDAVLLGALGWWYYSHHKETLRAGIHGKGTLKVKMVGAHNLMNRDSTLPDAKDKSDAYCVLRVGKEHYKTEVVKDSLNPVWKEAREFTFHIDFDCKNVDMHDLFIEVFDYDNILSSQSLGSLKIDVRDFAEYAGQKIKKTQTLKGGGDAQVELEATFEPTHPPVVPSKR